ncbi:MAG TPA: DNA-binding transcriptional regulator [Clostridiales bacterium]|nr:DNA-binding transcriptional regulator [Clostridiales bacterium]
MKIDRLIGIITVLQQKGKVTAPYLAEKFEVSSRTILRDVEDICRAGIPIVTTQGENGGIYIMDGFNLDTTVFTVDEMQTLLIGMKTLDSISPASIHTSLKEKLERQKSVIPLADSMLIDLSSFYMDSLSNKIGLLRNAVKNSKAVRFRYYYNKGERDKSVDPYLIVFKWSDWYLFGWCNEKQDFRMYKLNRLWELAVTENSFIPREIPQDKKDFGAHLTDDYFVTAIYDSSVKYRLVEEYGPHSFTVMEDGRLYTRWGFTNPDNTVSWFLSFGDMVEVLAPPEIRDKLKDISQNILKKYK